MMIVVNFSLPNKLSLLIFAFWFLAVFRRNLFCPFLCALRIKTGHYYPENIFGTFSVFVIVFSAAALFVPSLRNRFVNLLPLCNSCFRVLEGILALGMLFLLTSVSQTIC